MTSDKLIKVATEFYLSSLDFNGYAACSIHENFGLNYGLIRELFIELVNDGRGTIVFGDRHPNPHIRAFADESVEKQLQKLVSCPLEQVCLYPSMHYLSLIDASRCYQNRPFTGELALGAGQLEYLSFDLTVLESYRKDPRYHYFNNDIEGQICVTNDYYESEKMYDRDKIILETFGFSYDEKMNRAVAVFLRYLNRLSPEHQQIWHSKQLPRNFKLHPDYYSNKILGKWQTGISVFTAFLEELKIINLMCSAMDRPVLFRQTFENNRPKNFSFLVRPTQAEFNEFTMTLDKVMSENINKDFFKDEVRFEKVEQRRNGKNIDRPLGTIAILESWLKNNYYARDSKPIEDVLVVFKKVRNLRQKPAHYVCEDIFDQKFYQQQSILIVDAYNAVSTLRFIFSCHPAVRNQHIEIPDVLSKGPIWDR